MATTYYQNSKDAGLDVILGMVKLGKGFVGPEKKILENLAEKVTYSKNTAKLTGVIDLKVEKVAMGYEVTVRGESGARRIFGYDLKFFKSTLERILKEAYKNREDLY